jgi:hypothetical protein
VRCAERELEVSGCAFTDNKAAYDGAAIYNNDGELEVVDSTFTSNSSTGPESAAAAIYDDESTLLAISHDTFTKNSAIGIYGGGAVFAAGTLTDDHSTYTDNTTAGGGGAIDADGNAIINADTFAGSKSTDDDGGAVYADENVILTNSSFTDSTAADDGGAVYVDEAEQLTNDHFVNSTSTSGDGGAVYADDGATVADSTLTNSTAHEGGAFYDDSYEMLTLINSEITRATATDGGGGAIYSDGPLSLNGATITDGRANDDESGGAIYADDHLTVDNSSIQDSVASDEGGAIYDNDGGTIEDSVIKGNSSVSGGGGIYNDDELVVNNSTISDNTVSHDEGGGIYNGSDLIITNSSLIGNTATGGGPSDGDGGGIYNDSELSAANDTFSANVAYYGGAIYNDSDPTNIFNSTIAANVAREANGGGGIYNGVESPPGDIEVSTVGSIWANNSPDQCAGDGGSEYDPDSGGHNLSSDRSCGFSSPVDFVNTAAKLGALANNGGPTETIEPESGSPAIGGGGAVCPDVDQRGVAVPSSQPCDIGAVFVEDTTTTLSASTSSVPVGHEQVATYKVTVTPTVKGNRAVGEVVVMAGSKVVCVAKLSLVSGSKTGSAQGSCSPGASTLKLGTYSVIASYKAQGVLASSSSRAHALKVH